MVYKTGDSFTGDSFHILLTDQCKGIISKAFCVQKSTVAKGFETTRTFPRVPGHTAELSE